MPRGVLDKLVIGKTTFKPGDSLLLRSEEADQKPWIALLKKIEAPVDKKGKPVADAPLDRIDLHIDWYYRPEDVPGMGRKIFHGRREVLTSDHADKVPASTVEGSVTVHSLDAYRALPTVGPADYFWRFKYLAGARKFAPDRTPIHCVCGLPYNPDLLTIQCGGGCEDWFHPGCVGVEEDQARRYEAAAASGSPVRAVGGEPTFVCPACSKAATKSAATRGLTRGSDSMESSGGSQ